MTGLSLEGFNHLRSSRTTENRFNRVESPNPAWLCSTTFTATASSGTMLLVIMRSQYYVKMLKAIWLLLGRPFQTSESLEVASWKS